MIFILFFYTVFKRKFNVDTSPQNFQDNFLGPKFLENLSKCGDYCMNVARVSLNVVK